VIGFGTEPRYAELIRRLIGEEDISPPGFAIEVDRPEWSVLKNELLFFHARTNPAVAGNFSFVVITPIGNDRIVVVKKVLVINDNAAAAQSYKIGMAQAAQQTTPTRASSRDLRRLGVSVTAGIPVGAGELLASVPAFNIPANQVQVFDEPWVLQAGLPGGDSSLVVQGGVVNQSVRAYFWGYERRLRPEERVLD
jgi:hypothetical protein